MESTYRRMKVAVQHDVSKGMTEHECTITILPGEALWSRDAPGK